MDLDAQSFDYDLLFTVLGAPYTQTIPIDELYNVSWPVTAAPPLPMTSADADRTLPVCGTFSVRLAPMRCAMNCRTSLPIRCLNNCATQPEGCPEAC